MVGAATERVVGKAIAACRDYEVPRLLLGGGVVGGAEASGLGGEIVSDVADLTGDHRQPEPPRHVPTADGKGGPKVRRSEMDDYLDARAAWLARGHVNHQHPRFE